jgi:N-acyl-D-amino-acid deacylase
MGVSAGLSYTPGMFADDEEIAEVIAPLAELGGYYCPHHRTYGSRVVESYGECLALAERAGVPLHLAHCHVNFPQNRGRASEVLALIDAARAAGRDVTLDAYPYTASATYLASVLPSRVAAGGAEQLRRALEDPASRAGILHELEVTGSDGQHGVPIDWATTVVSSVARAENSWAVGSSIAELAAVRGLPRASCSANCCSPTTSAPDASCTSATRGTCARSCGTRPTPSAPTASWWARSRIRGGGGASRASSGTTCASSACWPSRRPSHT